MRLKLVVALTQVSFGEKPAEDSVGGTKSTKRRKKKNQAVDEGGPAAAAQVRARPSGGNAGEEEDHGDAEYVHHSVLFFICVFIFL